MLAYDPEERASALDCLKHPWLEVAVPSGGHLLNPTHSPRGSNSSRSVSPLTEGSSGGLHFASSGHSLYPPGHLSGNSSICGHSPNLVPGFGHSFSGGHLTSMSGSCNYSHHHVLPLPHSQHLTHFGHEDDDEEDLDEEEEDDEQVIL